jgi:hypothetical protein
MSFRVPILMSFRVPILKSENYLNVSPKADVLEELKGQSPLLPQDVKSQPAQIWQLHIPVSGASHSWLGSTAVQQPSSGVRAMMRVARH